MQCLYSQEGCHDLAWPTTSSIRNLVVADITQGKGVMIIVGEGKGNNADLVRTRQRGENVAALVVEIGHGWAVRATGQAGDSVEDASKCGRRGPDDG